MKVGTLDDSTPLARDFRLVKEFDAVGFDQQESRGHQNILLLKFR